MPEETFVNIGAKDGVHEDPLHSLLLNAARVRFALAVEMNPEPFGVQAPGSHSCCLVR